MEKRPGVVLVFSEWRWHLKVTGNMSASMLVEGSSMM